MTRTQSRQLTGITISRRIRIISADTGLPETEDGKRRPSTASWTSPSISPSRRRIPRRSRQQETRRRAAIPSASCASRTRDTTGESITPRERITGSFRSRSRTIPGDSSIHLMSITMSTASCSIRSTFRWRSTTTRSASCLISSRPSRITSWDPTRIFRSSAARS